ncbi:MAG: hypothetical protein AMXMBFR33_41410 [Candidatus Xenobia bacterium]
MLILVTALLLGSHARGTGQAEFSFARFKMQADKVRLTLKPGELDLHYEACSGDSVGPAAYLTFPVPPELKSLEALSGQRLFLNAPTPAPYRNELIPDSGMTRLKVVRATLVVEQAGGGALQARINGSGLLNGQPVTLQGRVQGPVTCEPARIDR